MTTFTSKTEMQFEKLLGNIALDATGEAHSTADDFAPRLGDLSFIPYRRAVFAYKLKLDASAGSGEATISLEAGGTALVSETLDLTSATEFTGRVEVDLSSVAGETKLKTVLDVGTAAPASRTGELDSRLIVEVPLITSSC